MGIKSWKGATASVAAFVVAFVITSMASLDKLLAAGILGKKIHKKSESIGKRMS